MRTSLLIIKIMMKAYIVIEKKIRIMIKDLVKSIITELYQMKKMKRF